ncbi:hypothetical protein CKM354_000657000 [Cercospora kikuchii]|uniref:Heterokaryon incompatibility domain-containing protein n=1 Tax=Cercospora kikuchii TaxID=84275 RepID=A0A9P3FDI9_9PEZI|nr:uncharacterized protein CKM354_000657000 [Cercospora kikuchii]GIZ43338.1 hypothetical protein CKM354_000657000 [Cercospora kikuchii]
MQDLSATDDIPVHEQTRPTIVPVGEICPLEDQQSQIRLVRFDRNHENETFEGTISLETHNLLEAPPYAALSYTWGSEISQQSLRVNGKDVSVFENSLFAIKQAFDEGSFVHIWTDSICIDQTSTQEKSVQVQLMSTIYRKAVHVLVSLGPDSNRFNCTGRQVAGLESHAAWAAWDADAPPAWAGNEDRPASKRRTQIMEHWLTHGTGTYSLSSIHGELQEIADLPYWTRVWIVQEISLAGIVRLMLGDYVIHWRSLAEFYKFVSSHSPQRILAPPSLQHASNLSLRMISTQQSLPKVLKTFSKQQCSDPRDQVYGLLSLISWPKQLGAIIPDYDKSVLAVAAEILKYGAQADEVLQLMRCEELERDLDQHVFSRRLPRDPYMKSQIWTDRANYHGFVNVHPMFSYRITQDAKGHLRVPFHSVRNYVDYPTENLSRRLRPSMPPEARQPLLSAAGLASVVGSICREACQGDLVAWQIYRLGWNVASSVGLVLRQTPYAEASGKTLYEIIGQCVPESGYAPCTLQEVCDCDQNEASQVMSYAQLPIELHLDPMDAIIYVGQDMDVGPGHLADRPGTRVCATQWSSFATVQQGRNFSSSRSSRRKEYLRSSLG